MHIWHFLCHTRKTMFRCSKKRTKFPELGELVGRGVIWAMPKRKHSFYERCSLLWTNLLFRKARSYKYCQFFWPFREEEIVIFTQKQCSAIKKDGAQKDFSCILAFLSFPPYFKQMLISRLFCP